jgi:hypothetical protein
MVVIAPRVMQRFGAKPMIVTGLLVLGIGLGIMSRATWGSCRGRPGTSGSMYCPPHW